MRLLPLLRAFAAFVLTFLPLSTMALGKANDSCRITFNGEESANYSISRLRDYGWEDDRIIFYGHSNRTLLLDGEGEYHFFSEGNKDNRLYLEVDGQKKLVWVSFDEKDTGSKHPNSNLSPEDMRNLRGIYIKGEPTDRFLQLLTHLDPDKAFVNIKEPSFDPENPGQFPAINNKIKFLSIYAQYSTNNIDYSHLEKMHDIEFLEISNGDTITYEWLANCSNLRFLDLSREPINDLGCLEGLQKLFWLNLYGCEDLNNIDSVRSLPNLRHLDISRTAVQDLSPIQDLKQIKSVHANSSLVKKLPEKAIPGLKELRVIAADVDTGKAQAFSEKNPQCMIHYSWNQSLQLAIKDVNKVRVRSEGTCHVDLSRVSTLFETTDPASIKLLCSKIIINPARSNFHCMCCGSPTLEFYKDGKLVAALGFHHGKGMRWDEGEWPGDAALTDESSTFLITWLDKNGVSGPKREVEKEQLMLAWNKWVSAIPSSLKVFWEDKDDLDFSKEMLIKMDIIFTNQFTDRDERILALLKWYGSGQGPWTGFPSYEETAEKLLFFYSTEAILSAIQGRKLSMQQTEGAARFFSGLGFSQKRPGHLDLMPGSLKKQLLEHSLKSDDDDKKDRARKAFGES